jgi:Thiolase, C-terminal domain
LPLAIKRAGLTAEQIDVWEVHEAFSAQAIGVLRELPNQLGGFIIPDDKLTPNGGAVAIGHQFGGTGARYVLTLATELAERNARYGAVGGMHRLGTSCSRRVGKPARLTSNDPQHWTMVENSGCRTGPVFMCRRLRVCVGVIERCRRAGLRCGGAGACCCGDVSR